MQGTLETTRSVIDKSTNVVLKEQPWFDGAQLRIYVDSHAQVKGEIIHADGSSTETISLKNIPQNLLGQSDLYFKQLQSFLEQNCFLSYQGQVIEINLCVAGGGLSNVLGFATGAAQLAGGLTLAYWSAGTAAVPATALINSGLKVMAHSWATPSSQMTLGGVLKQSIRGGIEGAAQALIPGVREAGFIVKGLAQAGSSTIVNFAGSSVSGVSNILTENVTEYRIRLLTTQNALQTEALEGNNVYLYPFRCWKTKTEIELLGRLVDTPGDGNCLFHAVREALPEAARVSTEVLRQQAVDTLGANQANLPEGWFDDYENGVMTAGGPVAPEDADEYFTLMAQEGTWGGALEVQALAIHLNRPIITLAEHHAPQRFDHDFNATILTGEPLVLYYEHGNHYMPMKPMVGQTQAQMIAAIIAAPQALRNLAGYCVCHATNIIAIDCIIETALPTEFPFFTDITTALATLPEPFELTEACKRAVLKLTWERNHTLPTTKEQLFRAALPSLGEVGLNAAVSSVMPLADMGLKSAASGVKSTMAKVVESAKNDPALQLLAGAYGGQTPIVKQMQKNIAGFVQTGSKLAEQGLASGAGKAMTGATGSVISSTKSAVVRKVFSNVGKKGLKEAFTGVGEAVEETLQPENLVSTALSGSVHAYEDHLADGAFETIKQKYIDGKSLTSREAFVINKRPLQLTETETLKLNARCGAEILIFKRAMGLEVTAEDLLPKPDKDTLKTLKADADEISARAKRWGLKIPDKTLNNMAMVMAEQKYHKLQLQAIQLKVQELQSQGDKTLDDVAMVVAELIKLKEYQSRRDAEFSRKSTSKKYAEDDLVSDGERHEPSAQTEGAYVDSSVVEEDHMPAAADEGDDVPEEAHHEQIAPAAENPMPAEEQHEQPVDAGEIHVDSPISKKDYILVAIAEADSKPSMQVVPEIPSGTGAVLFDQMSPIDAIFADEASATDKQVAAAAQESVTKSGLSLSSLDEPKIDQNLAREALGETAFNILEKVVLDKKSATLFKVLREIDKTDRHGEITSMPKVVKKVALAHGKSKVFEKCLDLSGLGIAKIFFKGAEILAPAAKYLAEDRYKDYLAYLDSNGGRYDAHADELADQVAFFLLPVFAAKTAEKAKEIIGDGINLVTSVGADAVNMGVKAADATLVQPFKISPVTHAAVKAAASSMHNTGDKGLDQFAKLHEMGLYAEAGDCLDSAIFAKGIATGLDELEKGFTIVDDSVDAISRTIRQVSQYANSVASFITEEPAPKKPVTSVSTPSETGAKPNSTTVTTTSSAASTVPFKSTPPIVNPDTRSEETGLPSDDDVAIAVEAAALMTEDQKSANARIARLEGYIADHDDALSSCHEELAAIDAELDIAPALPERYGKVLNPLWEAYSLNQEGNLYKAYKKYGEAYSTFSETESKISRLKSRKEELKSDIQRHEKGKEFALSERTAVIQNVVEDGLDYADALNLAKRAREHADLMSTGGTGAGSLQEQDSSTTLEPKAASAAFAPLAAREKEHAAAASGRASFVIAVLHPPIKVTPIFKIKPVAAEDLSSSSYAPAGMQRTIEVATSFSYPAAAASKAAPHRSTPVRIDKLGFDIESPDYARDIALAHSLSPSSQTPFCKKSMVCETETRTRLKPPSSEELDAISEREDKEIRRRCSKALDFSHAYSNKGILEQQARSSTQNLIAALEKGTLKMEHEKIKAQTLRAKQQEELSKKMCDENNVTLKTLSKGNLWTLDGGWGHSFLSLIGLASGSESGLIRAREEHEKLLASKAMFDIATVLLEQDPTLTTQQLEPLLIKHIPSLFEEEKMIYLDLTA